MTEPETSGPKIVCNWLHLSDYAALDIGSKAILVGIFDKIFAGRVPTMHPMCFLSFEMDGPALTTAKIRVQILRPGNPGSVMDGRSDCTFSQPEGRANFMLGLASLQLPDFGRYTILISADDRVIKTGYFSVSPVASKSGH